MSCVLPTPFNPMDHSPSTGGGKNLPISDQKGHLVHITAGEMRNLQSGNGTALVLTVEIIDGPNRGAEGEIKLNIGHQTSADAVRIALSELSAICYCVGHLAPLTDVSVLFFKPFRVVVALQSGQEAKDKGYTEVKRILDKDGRKAGEQTSSGPVNSAPASPAPPQQAQPPQGFPQQSFPQQANQQPQSQFPNQAPQVQFPPQQQAPQQQAPQVQPPSQPYQVDNVPMNAPPQMQAPQQQMPQPQMQPQMPPQNSGAPWAQPPQG